MKHVVNILNSNLIRNANCSVISVNVSNEKELAGMETQSKKFLSFHINFFIDNCKPINFLLLPYHICILIATYLNYSDLKSLSKVVKIFNQIFEGQFKSYKKFYRFINWNRSEWDMKLDQF